MGLVDDFPILGPSNWHFNKEYKLAANTSWPPRCLEFESLIAQVL